MQPDLARLPGSADDRDLPEEVQDPQLLLDAVAWSAQAAETSPATAALGKRRSTTQPPRPIVNVVVISHCDFRGNSALHVLAIASGLYQRGLSPVVAVPERADTVDDVGRPPFPVLTYSEVRKAVRFPNGAGPDLVHAFTPREPVRRVTADLVREHACAYVVHLEDNENAVLSAELGGANVDELTLLPPPVLDGLIGPHRFNPVRGQRFLNHAAGVTVIVERLLEFAPTGVPSAVVGAGFDEAVLLPRRARDAVRADLGIAEGELAIVYTGNIHRANLEDIRDLYAAVAALRAEGQPVVLVKTGWSSPEAAGLPQLGEGLRDLGWVPRGSVPELLAAADVLVQPGGPGPFNDYRLPSKLPEFLASGRPVVLPRTNVGLALRDGDDALVLERGDAAEIREAVARLGADPELRRRIGERGRDFALRELGWAQTVDRVEELYREIEAAGQAPAPAWALEAADPPVKLVAVVSEPPDERQALRARAHGVWGFCFPARLLEKADAPDFPYLLDVRDPGGEAILLASGTPVESPAPAGDYDAIMRARLAAPLPRDSWFRSISFPEGVSDRARYRLWLRKLAFQTALRSPAQEPLLFVYPGSASTERAARAAWLDNTQDGLRDAYRQLYACRGIDVSRRDIARTVRTVSRH
jgi:glycosyltransferase involved in cell wall biosynthesis